MKRLCGSGMGGHILISRIDKAPTRRFKGQCLIRRLSECRQRFRVT
jgi:hypothetical protein